MPKKREVSKIKSGLEIHQQLDTGKLFCRCPSILRKDPADWIVRRKLHAVAGEFGDVDIAARHEVEKGAEFVYEGYKDTCCLVEYDEQPPLEIDKEALKIVMQIALLLNCEILPVSQIMRKTVLDGSNTSGFQRTALIARNGFVETSFGKVGIQTVMIEEDAARKISDDGKQVVFRLDRLGIPLIEIATAPDMSNAEQIKETALYIGELIRTVNVRRGLGTIRQDLNISVGEHPRVEIKGFQDPAMMIKTVELEAERQIAEGKNGKPEVRKANPDGTTSFLRPMPGAARMYPETDLPLLKISKQMTDEIKKTLPKLKSKAEHKEELKKKGLSDELISQLLGSGMLKEFEALIKICNIPNLVAKSLLIFPKEIASHKDIKNVEEIITLDAIETVLQNVASGKISEQDVKKVLEKLAEGISLQEALKLEKVDLRHMEAEIAKIVKEKPGLSLGAYMGLVMKSFAGKVDGNQAMQILKKLVK